MANSGFSLDFKGFLDLAEQISEVSEDLLRVAVENAFAASKEYVNAEVAKAMTASKYNFDGTGYSTGAAKASLQNVSAKPVEWSGTTASAYIGVDLQDALEMVFIMYGSPHTPKDKNIYNAIKVKGKHKKRVEEIQREEFNKVLGGALGG